MAIELKHIRNDELSGGVMGSVLLMVSLYATNLVVMQTSSGAPSKPPKISIQ